MPKRYAHIQRQRRRDPEWPAIREQRRVGREQQQRELGHGVYRSLNPEEVTILMQNAEQWPKGIAQHNAEPTEQAQTDLEDVKGAVDVDKHQERPERHRELSAMRCGGTGFAKCWIGGKELWGILEIGREMLEKTGRLPATRKELLRMGQEMLELGMKELLTRGEEMAARGQNSPNPAKKVE